MRVGEEVVCFGREVLEVVWGFFLVVRGASRVGQAPWKGASIECFERGTDAPFSHL